MEKVKLPLITFNNKNALNTISRHSRWEKQNYECKYFHSEKRKKTRNTLLLCKLSKQPPSRKS